MLINFKPSAYTMNKISSNPYLIQLSSPEQYLR